MNDAASSQGLVQRPRGTTGLIFGTQPLSIAMVTVDLVLVVSWVTGDTTTISALLSHAVATLVLCTLAWVLQPANRIDTLGAMMTCLLLGPIGGFILVIVNLGLSNTRSVREPQVTGTAKTSSADNLHSQITQGRRRRLTGKTATNFLSVFGTGSLEQQQDAIASISLRYSNEMMPALQQALASDIPAVRVQAAAVFAKLRGEFAERAKSVMREAANGASSAVLAQEAQLVARSGFVDDETALALVCATSDLNFHNMRQHAAPMTGPRGDPLMRPPRLKRHSCGGIA